MRVKRIGKSRKPTKPSSYQISRSVVLVLFWSGKRWTWRKERRSFMAWRLLSPLLPNQLLSAGDTPQKLHLLPSTNVSLHCHYHNNKHLPCGISADGRYSLRASSPPPPPPPPSSSPRTSFPRTRLYVSGKYPFSLCHYFLQSSGGEGIIQMLGCFKKFSSF